MWFLDISCDFYYSCGFISRCASLCNTEFCRSLSISGGIEHGWAISTSWLIVSDQGRVGQNLYHEMFYCLVDRTTIYAGHMAAAIEFEHRKYNIVDSWLSIISCRKAGGAIFRMTVQCKGWHCSSRVGLENNRDQDRVPWKSRDNRRSREKG